MAIDANVGARVGDYLLVRKLGEGGMAEVWLARHVVTGELRAIKFLNRQFQGYPEVEARFQTEGNCQLIHPNIVRIYQVGQESGSSYIAMEFVDGRDLEKILDSRRGPLTIPEAVDIGMQILGGLGFAHANGIIHRDIKPSNVLLDSEGHAKLMDFGIAKAARATRSVTQVNSRLGTPDYMSPEQIRNPRDVDSRSDIYSFGCMFYELLTGWPPFDRNAGYETEHEIKTAHVSHPPTPPRERRNNLPQELNDVTLRCLAKAQEDRPQSCEEIVAALVAYRDAVLGSSESTRSIRRPADVGQLAKPSAGGASQPGMQPRRETETILPGGPPPLPQGAFTPQPLPNAGAYGSGAGQAGSAQQAGWPSGPGLAGAGVPPPVPWGPGASSSGAGVSAGPVNQPGVSLPPGGFGQGSRTATVTDEALYRQPSVGAQPGAGQNNLPPVPGSLPRVPEYVPPVNTGALNTGNQGEKKGMPKALMAIGAVLLLGALGGGGWIAYSKMHQDDNTQKNGGGQGSGGNSGGTTAGGGGTTVTPQPGGGGAGTGGAGNGNGGDTFKPPVLREKELLVVGAAPESKTIPGSGGAPTWKYVAVSRESKPACAELSQGTPVVYGNASDGLPPGLNRHYPAITKQARQMQTMTPEVKAACGQQYDAVVVLPAQQIQIPQIPQQQTRPGLAQGTLIWTGNPASFGSKFVTIVRSQNSAMQGGQLSGTMFPATPVQLTVRAPSQAMVQQPSAATHYNSFNLFFANMGQQTVMIDWKQLPN